MIFINPICPRFDEDIGSKDKTLRLEMSNFFPNKRRSFVKKQNTQPHAMACDDSHCIPLPAIQGAGLNLDILRRASAVWTSVLPTMHRCRLPDVG
jgi:hypothetical protein